MKYSCYAKLLLLACFSFFNTSAQTVSATQNERGGEYPMQKNDANNPCITAAEYKLIEERCAKNEHLVKKDNSQFGKTTATLFSWPLKQKNGLNDCGYYVISNYVDQDLTTGIKDWNCGAVTYDGHQGNDIAITPFPFLKMDNDDIEIVAAAPGTIIDKADGNFDKNCAMGNVPANYVIVQHADGSRALYWHMKKNSVTTKPIGQTVVTGEFLGRVGSSGSSTGPHLHFEVWSGSTVATRQDAYSGSCNTLNSNTWWANQKPYTEPAIIHASVNTAIPVFPTCPATETPNEDSCFTPPGTAKFIIYFRNETIGTTANMRIVNPDGSTFSSWLHNCTTNYIGSYWYWTFNLPTATGIYKFEAVYNNDTCTRVFKINCGALAINPEATNEVINIYPSPANDMVNISGTGIENGIYSLTVKNTLGQTLVVKQLNISNNAMRDNISVSQLPAGLYNVTIASGQTRLEKRFVKQDK